MHHLEVRAYDEEGNQFSSLEGFRFDWAILSGHENVMRVTPEAAGHSKTHGHSHGRNVWKTAAHVHLGSENNDDYFCKGINTGFVDLQARILEEGYEHVLPAIIHLTIV